MAVSARPSPRTRSSINPAPPRAPPAGTILRHLGLAATADQNEWAAVQPRAWTLLLETYEEVRRAARFLLGREMGDARFPSLVLASRGTQSRPVKNGEPGRAGEAPAGPEGEPEEGARARAWAPTGRNDHAWAVGGPVSVAAGEHGAPPARRSPGRARLRAWRR